MSTETPQPDDRVQVTFEADYWVVQASHLFGRPLLDVATVEVLKRADDPKVGEIRREDHDGGHSIWQVEEREDGERYWRCTYSTAKGNRGVTFELDRMLDLPVAGVVPGTPAAEAQEGGPLKHVEPNCGCDDANVARCRGPRPSVRVENTPHGLGLDVRQRVADYLVAGQVDRAIQAAFNGGLERDEATRYVKERPEYQTYLAEHGDRTEVDPVEADRMRAMGFDKQPEFKVSDDDRELIRSVLLDRQSEYFDGGNLYTLPLAGVVADIVWAALRRDRERGGR